MTDLDDALNSSSVQWAPSNLLAMWEEQDPNLVFSGNPDAPCYMDENLTGDYVVNHSLDDGLPDPVTMTNGNDASGKAVIPLNGKQGVVATSIGWRTPNSTTQTATNMINMSWPIDVQWGDYVIMAVTVNTNVVLTPWGQDDTDYRPWKLLARVEDSAFLVTYVYGRTYWDGMASLSLQVSSGTASPVVTVNAVYARTPDNRIVGLVPAAYSGKAEPASVTAHVANTVSLTRRGFVFGVFSSAASVGPWVVGAGSTQLAQNSNGNIILQTTTTPLTTMGDYAVTSSTTTATAVTNIVSVAMEVNDRPTMDARQYFSPFNKFSPVYGWDRDTAETTLTFNVMTNSGPWGTTLHTGQMADISIKGRQAEMSAISKTRIDMDKSLVLPVVNGDRENCTIDWLTSWIMARGGQFAGPAPGPLTIYWAPLYGSTHAHMDGPYGYNSAYLFDASVGSPHGKRPPSVVPGPFVSGMYACQDTGKIEEIRLNPIRLDQSREVFPNVAEAFPDGLFYDQMSLASSQGRITFWLRGDPVFPAPAYTGSGNDFIFKYELILTDSGGVQIGFVIVQIRSADRAIQVQMGRASTGSVIVSWLGALGPLNTAGTWDFYGIAWDYANGTVRVKRNGVESSSNTWTPTYNIQTGWPATDAAAYTAGMNISNLVRSHVPISDLQIESGAPAYSNSWTRHYPTPDGQNAIIRPTYQQIRAVAEPAPVQGWDTIADLAKSSLSAYRADEDDNFNFLPLSYFGESEQLTPTVIADTEVNAGELDVIQDPSKTRNVVTVNFPDTAVDTWFSPVLTVTSAVTIPRGVSQITFTLDLIAAEIHGQSTPFAPVWSNITVLTNAQIAQTDSIPYNVHYMTLSSLPDGSASEGTIQTTTATAKIVSATASTITLEFRNYSFRTLYLANNGDQIPFLRILGYPVRSADGYVTRRDPGSIGYRRERPMDTELPWVQSRDVASSVAGNLVSILARPRPEIGMTVMADPRRRPGQLVTVKDAQGTQADGNWRIFSVVHNVNGPQYTQDLKLVQVLPTGVWDGLPGWDESTWAE